MAKHPSKCRELSTGTSHDVDFDEALEHLGEFLVDDLQARWLSFSFLDESGMMSILELQGKLYLLRCYDLLHHPST